MSTMVDRTVTKVVLITGAASGIGLCFLKHYLSQSNTLVIGCDINVVNIQGFTPDNFERLKLYRVDFGSELSIKDTISAIALILIPETSSNQARKIDLVIHSAGIRGLVREVVDIQPNDVAAAETLHVMNSQTMETTYRINTVGTFVLLQGLASSNLLHGGNSHLGELSRVIIMTSRMGSISYNSIGSGYAYRASKAALNALVRSMSIDVPYVMFALVHPGRVETGLTRCREEGAIEVEESVRDMLALLDHLKIKDTGRFFDRFGKDIGW